MKKKIILTTGGTAGHIFPMVGLYEYLSTKHYEVTFVTDTRAKKYFNQEIQNKIKIFNVNSPNNQKGFLKIFTLFNLLFFTIFSFFFLIKEKPQLIIGSGGYASFPILMAAYCLKINIIIYETNSIIGRTNKFFYYFCKKLFIGFDNKKELPYQYQKKTVFVGQLLRSVFNNLNKKELSKKTYKHLTLLILGGSQTAKFFGENLASILKDINEKIIPLKIFHQCKPEDQNFIKSAYGNCYNVELFDFHSKITDLMEQTDLAIVRSGSSTLSELVYLNLPFIAVPLPSSLDNHQYNNAKFYEDRGCCWILEQKIFSADALKKIFKEITNNDNEQLKVKINNMKLLNKANVLENFEKEIKEYL